MVEVNVIVLTITLVAIFFILSKFKFFQNSNSKNNFSKIIVLAFVFVAIFITFDSVFSSYLSRLTTSSGFISNYFGYVTKLFSASSGSVSYQSNVFTAGVGLLLLLSIFVPILICLLFAFITIVKKVKNHEIIRFDLRTVFVIALLFPWFGDILIYTSQGVFPFKFVLLIYSLLAIYFIWHFAFRGRKSKKILTFKVVLICIIILLSFAKFGAWYQDPKLGFADSYDSSVKPVCSYLSHNIQSGGVISDLTISGRLLLQVTDDQKANEIHVYPFTSANTKFLYNDNRTLADEVFNKFGYDYLIISQKNHNQSIKGAAWLTLNPLGNASHYLESYQTFNRIYDDCNGIIYKYGDS